MLPPFIPAADCTDGKISVWVREYPYYKLNANFNLKLRESLAEELLAISMDNGDVRFFRNEKWTVAGIANHSETTFREGYPEPEYIPMVAAKTEKIEAEAGYPRLTEVFLRQDFSGNNLFPSFDFLAENQCLCLSVLLHEVFSSLTGDQKLLFMPNIEDKPENGIIRNYFFKAVFTTLNSFSYPVYWMDKENGIRLTEGIINSYMPSNAPASATQGMARTKTA